MERLRPLSVGEGAFGMVIFSVDSEEEPKRRQNQLVEGVRREEALEEEEDEEEAVRGKESQTRESEERVEKGK